MIKAVPRFGDTVNFIDENGYVIHSSTFIAADIVFTKNGSGMENPFVFEKLDDTRLLYETKTGPLKIIYLRKKFQQ